MTTKGVIGALGRHTATATPVEVSLWAQGDQSTDGSVCGSGHCRDPMMIGSPTNRFLEQPGSELRAELARKSSAVSVCQSAKAAASPERRGTIVSITSLSRQQRRQLGRA